MVCVDGFLFVTGGNIDKDNTLNTVEVYNPVIDKWTFGTPMDEVCEGHCAVVVMNH